MAGQPVARAEMGVLEHLGIEAICDMRVEGLTMQQIADVCACSRSTLARWLKRDIPGDQEGTRFRIWEQAGIALADTLVEKSRQVIEDAPLDRDAIVRAKALAEQYRWEASRRNRQAWGDAPTTAIQINSGDLHLQAMRSTPLLGPPHVEVRVHEPARPLGAPDDLDDFYGEDPATAQEPR